MRYPLHPVTPNCEGERCSVCQQPAAHKIAEEIIPIQHTHTWAFHGLTAYLCCEHFVLVMGSAALCSTYSLQSWNVAERCWQPVDIPETANTN
jgi:hypothetical protein